MQTLPRMVLALVFLMPCVQAQASSANIAILEGMGILDQCSRSSPPAGNGIWTPTSADIAALEALLPDAIGETWEGHGLDVSQLQNQYHRQYVGIVRDGKRYLYGNVFPLGSEEGLFDWHRRAMIVCDGGPAHFGVEMDVESGVITSLSFNGR
ncbi:hypothetical protein [Aureimonas pseudogalii]|uniref:Uncharacterized protein n=1 Tax=Aureimonas pseudogalii TaxID=1744844 RepID=A0A7W6H303_9HYPH|nr:hypothetical protein [Aureimonas pseudogalii]MBB3997531.1 hypothetical protein [Aureimonas pseudogalii]